MRNLMFGLIAFMSASVMLVSSVTLAGPTGRDLNRDFEGSFVVPLSERPVEPSDVKFEVRAVRTYEDGRYERVCYKLVAIDTKSGGEKVLSSCLTGNQNEVNSLIANYQQELREAQSEGRRIIEMPGHEFDEDQARRDRRQEERMERFR